jgi:hypothetical protein
MSSVYKNRQMQPRGGRTGESQSYIGEPIFWCDLVESDQCESDLLPKTSQIRRTKK